MIIVFVVLLAIAMIAALRNQFHIAGWFILAAFTLLMFLPQAIVLWIRDLLGH